MGNFFDILKIVLLGLVVYRLQYHFLVLYAPASGKNQRYDFNIVSALQIIADQIIYTLIYYYTGTIETSLFYFII